jgi:Secretion system C-terminal sorting domain
MRLALNLILLILGTLNTTFGQDLFFESVIFVTDARGNRDSVIIGIDPIVAGTGTNINSPFDSVLEVRAAIHNVVVNSNPPMKMLKRVISRPFDKYVDNGVTFYGRAERIQLFIHAKYQPVTFSWDSNAWQSLTTAGSWMTTESWSQTTTTWFNDIRLKSLSPCLGIENSFTVNLPTQDGWNSNVRWYGLAPIEGQGIDTLHILEIAPKFKYFFGTPCLYVGTNDELLALYRINIAPNPANDYLTISSIHKPKSIEIYDMNGACVLKSDEIDNIDISRISTGLKIIKMYMPDGTILGSKFVKL